MMNTTIPSPPATAPPGDRLRRAPDHALGHGPGHVPAPGAAAARPLLGAGLAGALLVGALGACGDPGTVDDATRERVEALGDSAAMTLVRALGGRLNDAVAAGGPAHAIEFCAGQALVITDSVSRALGPGWEVKRTTDRTRNPRNAPDSLEALALAFFRDADRAGDAPGPDAHVQRTATGRYRYYMPLRIGPMCIQCHGERSRIDPEVRRALDQRYPSDLATGYRKGDLRGVVRVTIPRAAVGG